MGSPLGPSFPYPFLARFEKNWLQNYPTNFRMIQIWRPWTLSNFQDPRPHPPSPYPSTSKILQPLWRPISIKIRRPEHSLNPTPLSPITSHFCLNPTPPSPLKVDVICVSPLKPNYYRRYDDIFVLLTAPEHLEAFICNICTCHLQLKMKKRNRMSFLDVQIIREDKTLSLLSTYVCL